jgi:hypothetical protein
MMAIYWAVWEVEIYYYQELKIKGARVGVL